jgi:hypothetical protein
VILMRLIDALQLPEVLDGSKWLRLPVSIPGRGETTDHELLSMTLGVHRGRGLYYCDGTYEPRALEPSHFGGPALLGLERLLGECRLVDAKKGP